MKYQFRVALISAVFLLSVNNAWSIPTSCGSTGLLTQPTAQTLNSGNICVGLWGDRSDWGQAPAPEYDATVMPFTITLGLGSFLEVYGSYPNLLFNDEESASGRGYSILGTKIRFLGKRSSLINLAAEAQFRRAVSIDPALDGLTDVLTRGILSIRTKRFGLHGWGGLLDKEENLSAVPSIGPYEDITGYGGGLEIFPTDRLRIIAEAEMFSEAQPGIGETGEWMTGFQYFISPHLTLSLGYGQALEGNDTGLAPESRILVGLSTCQGIGSYNQIKRTALPEEVVAEKPSSEPVKVLKIKTLSPLLSKSKPAASAPAITPQLPETDMPTENVSPIIPVVTLPTLLESAPATTAVEVPVEANREIELDPKNNIMQSDAYTRVAAQKAASPIGPPAMALTERPEASAGKARVYRRFLLPEFSFKVDQHSLTPEGSAALSMIAVELSRDNKWHALRIDGHTDSTGSDRYNDELAYNRAIEYAMHLVAKNGLDPSRVFVRGFGEKEPIAPNDTAEGRAQNRRVEILILVPGE